MREGLIPAIIGTAVTAAEAALRIRYPMAGTAFASLGLAHVVPGAIDLAQHRKQQRWF